MPKTSNKVVISCETSSFLLKEAVKARIIAAGYEVLDVGVQSADEQLAYYDAARRLA